MNCASSRTRIGQSAASAGQDDIASARTAEPSLLIRWPPALVSKAGLSASASLQRACAISADVLPANMGPVITERNPLRGDRMPSASPRVRRLCYQAISDLYHTPSRPDKPGMQRIFSGIQPTGIPHLGNYLG